MFSDRMAEIQEDGLFYSASEEEINGVQHLLAEPVYDIDTVDSILGFNVFSPEKYFDAKGASCEIQYGCRNGGAQDSDFTQDKTKLEFIDDPLQPADDGAHEGALHVSTNIQAVCEDYFLDDGSPKGYAVERSSPGRECLDVNKTPESATSITVPESSHTQNSNLLDKMTLHELHDAFTDMFGRKTQVNDKQWLKNRVMFGLQNLGKVGKDPDVEDHRFSTHVKEYVSNVSPCHDLSLRVSSSFPGVLDDTTMLEAQSEKGDTHAGCEFSETLPADIDSTRIDSEESEGAFFVKRRSRKPAQRYADESLMHKPKRQNKNFGVSLKKSRDSYPRLNSAKHHHETENVATTLICEDESFKEAIQVPFGFPIQKPRTERSKPFQKRESDDASDCTDMRLDETSKYESDEESGDGDESDDESMTGTRKGSFKRKARNLWTLSEMIKLIEGVSQHGVGKWKEIRNNFFSSHSPRTSVHLKDKWRNLSKAAIRGNMVSNGKVKIKGKSAERKVQALLSRVLELSDFQPEKEDNLEDSSTSTTSVAPNTPVSSGEDAMLSSFAMTGKYIQWFQQ